MNGKTAKRIRKLMYSQFPVLDVFVRSKQTSKNTKKVAYPDEWPWTRVYRNVKKLYYKNKKDRIFFDELLKKENI